MLNNPLTLTDPSGFFLKKLARTVKKIWKNDVVQAAVTIATAVYGGPVAAAAYVGGKTAIDTGSISSGIKAGLITYGTAQAFQWAGDIGEAYGATARYAAHAVVGCVSSVANHGECGAGAVTSVMALAATGNLKPNQVYFNTAVHAVVGGTASVIAGGKFANGTVTGSFRYLFNCIPHECWKKYPELTPYKELIEQGGIDWDANLNRASSMGFRDFYDAVRSNGEWDYKIRIMSQNSDLLQEFGNFHFGAMAAEFGFSLPQALYGAGSYQAFFQNASLSQGILNGWSPLSVAIPGQAAALATMLGYRWGDNAGDSSAIMNGYLTRRSP